MRNDLKNKSKLTPLVLYGGAGRDMILSATGLNWAPQKDRNSDGILDDWAPPAGAGPVLTSGRLWGIYANSDGSDVIDGGGSLAQDGAGDIVFAEDGDDRAVGGLGDDYIDGGAAPWLCKRLNKSINHRVIGIYN